MNPEQNLSAGKHQSAINRSHNKTEMTGGMTNNKGDVDGKTSIRTQENVQCVQQAFMQSTRKSI
jgi:hypothetical protein